MDFSLKYISSKNTSLELVNWATEYLNSFSIESPRRNAEEIFSFVSGVSPLDIYLKKEKVGEDIKERFISLIEKRKSHYPLQYIIKRSDFYGLKFKVTPGVFIPRQETEVLVEKVIDLVKSSMFNVESLHILDIGTGSGCIAISLAKFLSSMRSLKIIAIDISPLALKVAQENAWLNGVEIEFIQADMFKFEFKGKFFDLIVSNPPYIPSGEIFSLQPEIKYEPRIALDGGKDGLFYIKRIIQEVPHYLKREGILAMEIGFGQRERIMEIYSKSEFNKIEFFKDLLGIERVAILYNGKVNY